MPSWFHVGFRYETRAEVEELYDVFKNAGFNVGQLDQYDDYWQFRFKDPSGYMIEICWEPPPNLWN